MGAERIRARNALKTFQYKLNLHKSYFDTGLSLTQLVKYIVLLVGGAEVIKTHSAYLSIILVLAYGLFCYLIGLFWFKFGFRTAEIEVSNQFNLFVKEIRQKRKI